jgi:hypothetical protein
MTDAQARRFARAALSFEGVTQAPHMDRTAFRARRNFATLAADGANANLLLTLEDQAMKTMLAPDAFAPVKGGWGAMGWTRVDLAVLSDAELADALRLAHARGTAKTPRRR